MHRAEVSHAVPASPGGGIYVICYREIPSPCCLQGWSSNSIVVHSLLRWQAAPRRCQIFFHIEDAPTRTFQGLVSRNKRLDTLYIWRFGHTVSFPRTLESRILIQSNQRLDLGRKMLLCSICGPRCDDVMSVRSIVCLAGRRCS